MQARVGLERAVLLGDVGHGRPGAHREAIVKATRQVQRGAVIASQVASDAALGQHIVKAGLQIAGYVAGKGGIVTEAEVLLKTALLDLVKVCANCPVCTVGAVQHFTANTAVHPFKQTCVGHGIQVKAKV